MIYVDTSVWIALQLREVKTEVVQAWFMAHGVKGLACSDWVRTEYASALSIKRRRGDMDDICLTRAHQTFSKICTSELTWLNIEKQDFVDAANLCANPAYKMRAGDALHLAVAMRCRCTELLSLDTVLNDNAKRLGMNTITL